MNNITNLAKNFPEYDNHKEVFRFENKELGVVGFIAIHSKRGTFPSLGATRMWNYPTETEGIKDALRLSKLMSHKSVLANLPYGGAKAVLMIDKNTTPDREKIFTWYASKLNELSGIFITGSDVGIEEADVSLMRNHSNYVIGSNVPAGYYTALGVFNCIELVLESLFNSSKILGRTFAIQGLGKTGAELAKILYTKGGKIIVSDINSNKVAEFTKKFPGITSVDFEEIHNQNVDVFCPCAMNYSINKNTIPKLKCLSIVGSANNQMENQEAETNVYQKNILYAVDYITNNGGLISVVDQYENKIHDNERIIQKLLNSKNTLKKIFISSKNQSKSPGLTADNYALSILNNKA